MTAELAWDRRPRLLLVTGPIRNRVALRQFLSDEIGEVSVLSNDGGLEEVLSAAEGYQAVLVDLPAGERVYLCARMRGVSGVPLLVLGDSSGFDAPACLDAGADDYLAHPERLHEVAARVRARMRRAPVAGQAGRLLDCAGITMDMDRHHVEVEGRLVILPLKQFRLLELLLTHAGQVVTNRAIVEHVWGPLERVDRNTVQAHVARLRQTLGNEEVARRIRAVPGVGYTFPR